MSNRNPRFLFWTDLETTSLPVGTGFTDVHLLEIAVIITDFSLNKLGGYSEVIKLTPEAAESIRNNKFVREMHTKSGLLKESIQDATTTMAQAEREIVGLLNEFGEPGDFVIAGSGVAAFDHPFIKDKMPDLNLFLVYYPFDIGIFRRVSKILSGRHLVPYNGASYGAEKVHRALADVQAHLLEAEQYRDVLAEAFG